MDTTERKLLNKVLPKLVENIKVDTKFKAAIYAAEILEDETLEGIFKHSTSDEMVFQLVQNIKKKGRGGVNLFVSALKNAGQENAAKFLDPKFSLESHEQFRTSSELQATDVSPKDTSMELSASACSARASTATRKLGDGYNLRMEQSTPQKADRTTQRSSRSSTGTDYRRVQELRERMKDCIPPNPYTVQHGDMAIQDSYLQQCARFQRGRILEVPGPYANPPDDKVALNANAVGGIEPGKAAKLSKVLGGRPRFFYQSRHGGTAIVSQEGNICYLSIVMCNRNSTGSDRMNMWAKPSATLADIVAASFGWYPAKIETATGKIRSISSCTEFVELDPNITTLSFYTGPAPTSCLFVTMDTSHE